MARARTGTPAGGATDRCNAVLSASVEIEPQRGAGPVSAGRSLARSRPSRGSDRRFSDGAEVATAAPLVAACARGSVANDRPRRGYHVFPACGGTGSAQRRSRRRSRAVLARLRRLGCVLATRGAGGLRGLALSRVERIVPD